MPYRYHSAVADINSLPQELVDAIVDELYDDRSALKACALVSHAFLPRCRVHLWRTLGPINWITFQSLSKKLSPTLRRYVRAVVFANGYPLDGSMIPSLDTFPNLHTLHLKDPYRSYWMGLDTPPPPPRLSLSPNGITSLSFTSFIHDMTGKCTLLRPFTSLKHLAFETYDQGPCRSVCSCGVPGPRLESLTLDCRRWKCDASETFRAVLGNPCLFNLDALRRLTVHVHGIGEVEALRKLLERARETLEEFTLTVERAFLNLFGS